MTSWHDEDAFWEAFGPFLFTPERVESARADADALVGLLGLHPGRTPRILDLPCGVGRHSIVLAQRGFRVTGVDRTAAFIAIARARTPEGIEVDWRVADIREFDGRSAFDAAINLFSSIGYFEEPAQNVRALTALRRSLRPGAPLVVDVLSKEILARTYRPRHWDERPDGSLHLVDVRFVDHLSRIESRWILVRPDGSRLERAVRHWVYSAHELDGLLESAGFVDRRVFGSLAGAPYDLKAERLVAVAHAP